MKIIRVLFATVGISLMMLSCDRALNDSLLPEVNNLKISNEVLRQLKDQGFSTVGVQRFREGYLVEGDIFLHDSLLSRTKSGLKVSQYRTNNLLNLPRTVTVSVSGFTQVYTTATDEAIARYNAQNLRLQFQRVPSGGDINIVAVNWGPNPDGSITLGASGFPTNGNPYNQIELNTNQLAYGSNPTDVNYLATTIAHEIGHCIGFRHTDYFNRAYSCPWQTSNTDEGQNPQNSQGISALGAVNIPGTPTGADANSWMLACINTGVNRPFTGNDITALQYLFGNNCAGLTNVQTIVQDGSVWFTWDCSSNPSWASISWQEINSNGQNLGGGTTQTDCSGGNPGHSSPQISAQHGSTITAILTPKCFSGANGPATTLTFTIP